MNNSKTIFWMLFLLTLWHVIKKILDQKVIIFRSIALKNMTYSDRRPHFAIGNRFVFKSHLQKKENKKKKWASSVTWTLLFKYSASAPAFLASSWALWWFSNTSRFHRWSLMRLWSFSRFASFFQRCTSSSSSSTSRSSSLFGEKRYYICRWDSSYSAHTALDSSLRLSSGLSQSSTSSWQLSQGLPRRQYSRKTSSRSSSQPMLTTSTVLEINDFYFL